MAKKGIQRKGPNRKRFWEEQLKVHAKTSSTLPSVKQLEEILETSYQTIYNNWAEITALAKQYGLLEGSEKKSELVKQNEALKRRLEEVERRYITLKQFHVKLFDILAGMKSFDIKPILAIRKQFKDLENN